MNLKNPFLYKQHRLRGIVAALLLCLACEDPPIQSQEPISQEFLISAGEHYATPKLMKTTEAKSLSFLATFDESARYALADPSLQSNINKLMGFSDCSTHHHENSARFGWRWADAQIEILAYCYVDGVRIHEPVGTVNINEENFFELAATADAYIFSLNGEVKTSIPRKQSCGEGLNYILYPYFGGSAPAPQDVRIKIRMVG